MRAATGWQLRVSPKLGRTSAADGRGDRALRDLDGDETRTADGRRSIAKPTSSSRSQRGLSVIRAFDGGRADADAERGRQRDRARARRRAAVPADARRPRLRPGRGPALPAQPARARARPRVPVEPPAAGARVTAPRERSSTEVRRVVHDRRCSTTTDIVYVAHVPATRIMSISIRRRHARPGLRHVARPRTARRLRARSSSTRYLAAASSCRRSTTRTVADADALRAELANDPPPGVRARRPGARGRAAGASPSRSTTATGRVVAALNLAVHASRWTDRRDPTGAPAAAPRDGNRRRV